MRPMEYTPLRSASFILISVDQSPDTIRIGESIAGDSLGYIKQDRYSLRFDRLSANGRAGSARTVGQAQRER